MKWIQIGIRKVENGKCESERERKRNRSYDVGDKRRVGRQKNGRVRERKKRERIMKERN